MLDNLKFVQRAVKVKTLDPELKHYRLGAGRVTAFNGRMALSAPLDLDIEACPDASTFYHAIAACKDTVAIHLTDKGRLAVRSGGFRAFIPCLEQLFYDAKPEGDLFDVPDGFLDAMETVYPFISEDASREWSMGALVSEGTVLATNNVTLLQVWIGHALPTFNLPRYAVWELLRIKEAPIKVQVSPFSATFHYTGDRWFRTQLMSSEWPFDRLQGILSVDCSPKAIPPGFSEAVDTISGFLGDRSYAVYFIDDGLCTKRRVEDDGVHLKLEGVPNGPVFNVQQLLLLSKVAETIDFSLYPNPALFFGKNLRGAMAGMSP